MKTKIMKQGDTYYLFYEQNNVFKLHSGYSTIEEARSAREKFEKIYGNERD